MDNIKKFTASTKKFVSDHRVAIAVGATCIPWMALQLRNARILNDFLAEHNLLDEYYETDEE